MTQTVETMREYETIYVLNPEVSDANAKEFMIKMKDLVGREGGKSIKVDCWGRKRLAWERNKLNRGLFVHHLYIGKPEIVKEYERTLAIDEKVILRQSIMRNAVVDMSTCEEQADQFDAPVMHERREFVEHRHNDYGNDDMRGNNYDDDMDMN
ncbi:MAG: 30S ribosomal protein S6 [bacterium]|nr:30S ribosomal protein S6 [bacterium]